MPGIRSASASHGFRAWIFVRMLAVGMSLCFPDFLHAQSALPPSFRCTPPLTQTEQTICRDPELAAYAQAAGAVVGDRVDASGQATDNRASRAGEPTGKLMGYPSAVGRRVTGAHNGNRQGVAGLETTANEEDTWRVVNLTEQAGVGCLALDQDANATPLAEIDRFLGDR